VLAILDVSIFGAFAELEECIRELDALQNQATVAWLVSSETPGPIRQVSETNIRQISCYEPKLQSLSCFETLGNQCRACLSGKNRGRKTLHEQLIGRSTFKQIRTSSEFVHWALLGSEFFI
jgi:hypothetical protein